MRARLVLVLACVGVLAVADPAFAADTTAPTTPTNLRVTASTASSVTLAWDASSDASGSWTYVLADNFGNTTYHPKTATSATRTSLFPARTYVFTVQAFDAARNYSGVSAVSHTTPPDTTPPSAPVLSVTYLAPARAAVTWTASTDNSIGIITYSLLVDGAPRTGDIRSGRGQVLLDLTPATAYAVVVVARDGSGNTASSPPRVVTTPAKTDFAPPTAPGNLRGRTDFSECEVYLSWDQSTDNVEPPAAILYRFRVNGLLSPPSSFVIGRGTNVGVTVLEGHHAGPNSFHIEALDGSGNASALSNELVLSLPSDC